MTFDLEAAKRLALQLAGDVLNQIERDGSVNRENIADQLLAGLVLEAARDRLKGNVARRAGLSGISEEFPLVVTEPIGGLQALVNSLQRRVLQDIKTVDVKLWRMEKGERVPVEATPGNARYLEMALREDKPVEMVGGDIWFFPNGRVMSGLELASIGYSAAFLWSETGEATKDLK